MDVIELIPKEVADKTNATIKKAEKLELTITNDSDYEKSADVLRDIKTWYNAIYQERKKILDPHEKTKNAIVSFFSKFCKQALALEYCDLEVLILIPNSSAISLCE